ncbi:hypothetical protein BH23ACT5_BH23ACT5_23610 [soil metagenome]
MILSGALTDWTVTDLLSMLTVTKKAATLRIEGARSGQIHFFDGKVSGASLDGEPDDDTSRPATADALYALSALEEGSFEIDTFSGPDHEGWSVETLTGDIAELRQLMSDLASGGLTESPLMLAEEISGPVTISSDDWWAVASLVSVLSLDQLEAVFGSGRATRLLHTLWRLNLVEPVDISEEAMPAAEIEAEEFAQIEAHTNEALEDDFDDIAKELAESLDDNPEIAVANGNEDAWLDEIAANAGGEMTPDQGQRRLTGVSAPASTVLTGSVLDEMRRLRSRPSTD